MTRVEGENTRLRHYLTRLHRKTLCYLKSVEIAGILNSIVTPLSKLLGCFSSRVIHTAIMQRPPKASTCGEVGGAFIASHLIWCSCRKNI